MLRKRKEEARITEYAKEVKKKLIDMDKTQDWLIEQVKEVTGLYMDDSYLSKLFTGKRQAPKIVQAINQILGMSTG